MDIGMQAKKITQLLLENNLIIKRSSDDI